MFWTDSQSVLKYIGNDHTRFKTYVANRVSFIRENSNRSQWRYVSTKYNPADEASRGMNAEKFLEYSRWIHGPEFLWFTEDSWLKQKSVDSYLLSKDDPEVKGEIVAYVTVLKETETPTSHLISYFSNWTRLLKAVAWYLRLRSILSLKVKKRKEPASNIDSQVKLFKTQRLTVEELALAEKAVIIYTQITSFPAEMTTLKTKSSSVLKKFSLYRLDPMLNDGILRVGGRLHKLAMPEETKHQVILPKDAHISTLLLRHAHEQSGHSGRNYILSHLRKKYWIVKGNSAARRIIFKCVICRRIKGRTVEQKMADLPLERILPDLPPFTNVGLDYFGPIEVKRGRGYVKRYGVIFTCMSSRAIHLEVANSLETDSCIHAIRRFVCRRGQVKRIRSDNGTNLVGSQKELKKALNDLDKDRIQDSLLKAGIQWSFNPPAASHHGGVWERLIRSARQVLNSILYQQSVDEEGLQTIFCEVEAILNNRPLCTVSSDPHDKEPLTPNHILLLKSQPILPPGVFSQSDSYARRRWKQIQYLADLFWHRWTKEYLMVLQECQKWVKVRRNINTGDVVMVVDPNAPRGSWILGKVLTTEPDKKGLVRSVTLKTKTSTIKRPVTKLCLILEENKSLN